jgi:uncharacterized protein YjiS (DUF1127 family)
MTIAMTWLNGRFWSPVSALRAARTGAAGQRMRGMRALFGSARAEDGDSARYRRMRDEIARMPPEMALDLGIHPGDADELARRAVYGA